MKQEYEVHSSISLLLYKRNRTQVKTLALFILQLSYDFVKNVEIAF